MKPRNQPRASYFRGIISCEQYFVQWKLTTFGSIEYDPENLMAINTLAGMGVLTEDDGLVDAALSELLSLPLDQRRERDPEREVTYLLIQHSLGQVSERIAPG